MRDKIGDTIGTLDDTLKLIEEIREKVNKNTFLDEGVRRFLAPQIELVASNVRVARQQMQYMSDFVPETKGVRVDSRGIGKDSTRKGKRAEFLVFGELIKRGADLYLPVVDTGIDAILRLEDGSHRAIQVKSTEASEQAGWFNVWDLEFYEGKHLFIVCVEMSKEPPEIWVLPSKVFMDYANVSKSKEGWNKYTLGIDSKDTKHGNDTRRNLLKEYLGAWERLTG